MSLRVYAWDVNPTVAPFLYRLSNNRAQELVATGRGELIPLSDGRHAVQLKPTQAEEKSADQARKRALIPYGRVLSKLMHPPSLNYPVPFVGALRLTNYCWQINQVGKPEAIA